MEYADQRFHIGGLTHYLETVGDDDDARQYRNVRDVTLDATALLGRLEEHKDRIECVHVVADSALDVEAGGASISLVDELIDRLGDDRVREVDVYDEYEATLP